MILAIPMFHVDMPLTIACVRATQAEQAEALPAGASPGGLGAARAAAAAAVLCACTAGAWAAVLEGLHLFLPASPLAPAARLLQARTPSA